MKPSQINVLIGCESSGQVRRAFRARGFNAWSCDLLPADDLDEHHYEGDVRDALKAQRWHPFIVHPECTYLCSSGLHWNKRGKLVNGRPRAELTEEALLFVQEMLDAPVPHLALENPQGCIGTRIRPASQYIQPYEFGHDASKKTGLWLNNLPLLTPTKYVQPRLVCDDCKIVFKYGLHKCPSCRSEQYKPRWANQTDSGQNKLGPSEDRWRIRSETYPGIAAAMAQQWGDFVLKATTC